MDTKSPFADGRAMVTVRERWRLQWVLAALLYGVGDVVTTLVGLQLNDVGEAGPVASYAMEVAGPAGFLGVKALFMGGCFLVWWRLESPSRVAIPAALVAAGAVITVWNGVMILL